MDESLKNFIKSPLWDVLKKLLKKEYSNSINNINKDLNVEEIGKRYLANREAESVLDEWIKNIDTAGNSEKFEKIKYV